MGKEDHRKSNLCYTFDGRLRGIAKFPENVYGIAHNLHSVNWSFAIGYKESQKERRNEDYGKTSL